MRMPVIARAASIALQRRRDAEPFRLPKRDELRLAYASFQFDCVRRRRQRRRRPRPAVVGATAVPSPPPSAPWTVCTDEQARWGPSSDGERQAPGLWRRCRRAARRRRPRSWPPGVPAPRRRQIFADRRRRVAAAEAAAAADDSAGGHRGQRLQRGVGPVHVQVRFRLRCSLDRCCRLRYVLPHRGQVERGHSLHLVDFLGAHMLQLHQRGVRDDARHPGDGA